MQEEARQTGVALSATSEAADFLACAGAADARVAIVDLSSGPHACEVIGQARAGAGTSLTIVAFGPHTEVALLDRARQSGADLVLPRSAFIKALPAILAGRFASIPRED